MDPVMKLLDDDEDEGMHSGADVEAFTEALNREVKGSGSAATAFSSQSQPLDHGVEKNEESNMKGFPAIYLMDCTSNECHHLLKSVGKEELYPALLLSPAENKSAISYEGGMSVAN